MFEWDENKRLSNLEKHTLDFMDSRLLFDGRQAITFLSTVSGETRYVTTAEISGRFYSVVWTWRRNVRRIISYRRARDEEKRTYRQVFG
ncbi:MAG: BrnT family toxin [Chlorobiaceae bacterium]|nr:BrnT family toxin [Chlorobiaceae bacterium]